MLPAVRGAKMLHMNVSYDKTLRTSTNNLLFATQPALLGCIANGHQPQNLASDAGSIPFTSLFVQDGKRLNVPPWKACLRALMNFCFESKQLVANTTSLKFSKYSIY